MPEHVKPTIADVARALHLSISSVSCALNGRPGVSEETRRRVIDYAETVGYRPTSSARALSRARAGAIGVVIRESYAIVGAEAYYLRFLSGVASTLEGTDTELIVKLSEQGLTEELAVYRRWAAERRVDGVILLDESEDDPRMGLLDDLRLPAVLHGTAPSRHPRSLSVLVDDAADAALIAEHLAEKGCRRVLHAGGPQRHRHESVRSQALREQCLSHGMEYRHRSGSYGLDDGVRAAGDLIDGRAPRADALVAANDLIAVGACRALREAGVAIPAQCRVIAWDDSVLCQMAEPPVSALDRQPERHGSASAALLLDAIGMGEGRTASAAGAVLRSTLQVRGSTAP